MSTLDNASSFAGIVDDAHAADLPEPNAVTIYRSQVSLNFNSLADLTAWALYLDARVSSKPMADTDEYAIHHTFDATYHQTKLHGFYLQPKLAAVASC